MGLREKPILHGDDHRPLGPDPIPGGGSLSIWDGTLTVDPVTRLILPESSGRLSDPGGGDALFQVGEYFGYTPVLSSTGTAPSGTKTLVGNYYQASELVACWGKLTIGAGFDPGTGAWRITIPLGLLEWSGTSNRYIGTGLVVGGGNMLPLWVIGATSAGNSIDFFYPGSWPVGATKEINTGGDWTFANGDIMQWMVVFPTGNT